MYFDYIDSHNLSFLRFLSLKQIEQMEWLKGTVGKQALGPHHKAKSEEVEDGLWGLPVDF